MIMVILLDLHMSILKIRLGYMYGGRGRVGYFAQNMDLDKFYSAADVEDFFKEKKDDPENSWGVISRSESKAIISRMLRSKCYAVERVSHPIRRIKLTERYHRPEPDQKREDRSASLFKMLMGSVWSGGFELAV